MKKVFVIVMFSVLFPFDGYCDHENDSFLVVFWNLENFYDYIDDGGGESDKEFSSFGSRRWTKKRFQAKCDAVTKSFLWIKDRYGRLPDVIGLAEIENRGVLAKMIGSTLLRKYDYRIIHRDSGDRRGIDVALLYRSSSADLVSVSFKTPEIKGIRLSTRDILHAELCLRCGRKLNFIVNHHPSKFGGANESEVRRMAAMTALREMCDSLGNTSIVAMGDFNDDPSASAFGLVSDVLINKSSSLYEKGEGTIRYEGKWDLIDMFLLSHDISHLADMDIVKVPFLMTREKKHPGEKPLRTYSGPRYVGGVSDHCPVILNILCMD